jgi:ATP-binding cassette subfamily D (ALD) long-chain fatty acid import protein
VIGQGDSDEGWEFERIGTEREKMQVEKELQDLRERLAKVDEWKKRREEIDAELAAVWTDKGDVVDPPPYTDSATEPVQQQS